MPVAEIEDVFQPAFKQMPPGPGLALLLGAQEYTQLDDFDIVELARSAQRLTSWAASLKYAAVAELTARRKNQGQRMGAWDSETSAWVTCEVAAALTLSDTAAAHLVAMSAQLAETLPGTCRALQNGQIDVDKAKVIANGVRGVGDDVAGQVEDQVLPEAPAQTCAQLRYAVRKAVRQADPEACARARKAAEEDRRLELWDTDAGTSDLSGRDLPAEKAGAAWNRVNAIAQAIKTDGDDRAIDQIRADVFLALLLSQRPDTPTPPAPTPPTSAPPSPSTTTPSSTRPYGHTCAKPDGDTSGEGTPADAAGEGDPPPGGEQAGGESTEHEGTDNAGDTGGRAAAAAVAETLRRQLTELTDELSPEGRKLGGQAALVREAASRMKEALADLNSRWCINVTDRNGNTVQHGVRSYRVPDGMRRLVQSRDGTCRFPGCRRRATQCDADHTVAHHKDGPTCPCNLSSLCRRHHRLKQRPEWQLIQVWHGVLLWIAPTGHWYLTRPE